MRRSADTELKLSKNLARYLEMFDMTATQLSLRTGIPKSVLSGWMSGMSPQNLTAVRNVAKEFGVSFEDLCFGNSSGSVCKQIERFKFEVGLFEVNIKKLGECNDPELPTGIRSFGKDKGPG